MSASTWRRSAIIGVKSTNHFHAAYGADRRARCSIADGDGPSPLDARKYPVHEGRAAASGRTTELPEGRMIV